jgi:hypothetical protein
MERNADDIYGATGDRGATTGGSSSMGAAGASSGALGHSTIPSQSTLTPEQTAQAKAAAQSRLNQAKDKARQLQSNLADRLDAQAEKLRNRKQTATLAGAADATVGVASTDRMGNVQDSVARGMHKSADWLRNGDLRADIERQVRENPGRTLLVALGVGYLLGKAIRRER